VRYRLGRSHSDIVYRQLGDEPDDEDPRVAVFTEAVDAIAVVALLNGEEDDRTGRDGDDPEPVFPLYAHDRLTTETVWRYLQLCTAAGLTRQADQVALALAEINDWQGRHPDQLRHPDHTHRPAGGERHMKGTQWRATPNAPR
jgi:hypothetical protein